MDRRTIFVEGLAAAAVWGAVWGSFFNVVIYRLPRGMSLVRPGSHCPRCGHSIRWWQNIPILSWLLLRGRCASCRASIPVRYPLVEALSALLAAAVWARYAADVPVWWAAAATSLVVFFFAGLLLVVAFIDIDYRIIPHALTLPAMVLGVAIHAAMGQWTGVTWQEAALGLAVGAGVIWLIIQVYFWVRHREGMGGGDFMLMGAMGAWLGVAAIAWVLLAASLMGTLFAVFLAAAHWRLPPPMPLPGEEEPFEEPSEEPTKFSQLELPFGPFLALAGLQWLLLEPWIQRWVYGLYGGP